MRVQRHSKKTKEKMRDERSKVTLSIQVNDEIFQVTGNGDRDLILEHPHDIVIRKRQVFVSKNLGNKLRQGFKRHSAQNDKDATKPSDKRGFCNRGHLIFFCDV